MENPVHLAMLILHVLGATIIIGTAFVSLIIEIKKFDSKQIVALNKYLWKITGLTIVVQMITGLYLANAEWDKIGKLQYFWLKMFLFVVIGGLVGFMSHRRTREEGAEKVSTQWTLIAFLTFAIIAALGVMIAESAS